MNEHTFLDAMDPRRAAALIQAAILHHLLAAGVDPPTLAQLVRAMAGPGFSAESAEHDGVRDAVAALVADGLVEWRGDRLAPSHAARSFDRLMFSDPP